MEQATIGCDLGDRWTQICVLAGGGEIVDEARVRTTSAVVAAAHKLSVLLHRLQVSGDEYVPIGYTG